MSKENIITQIKKNSNEVYRISEKEYEGYRFIDVRIYYQDRKTQEWKPTTKGISIMPNNACLLYTSPSPRDQRGSRMPSSA